MTDGIESKSIGFVGLGNMGFPMAERLIMAGNSLIVYDIDPNAGSALAGRGAIIADSLSELSSKADILFISVPSPEIARQICSTLSEADKVRIVVDLSTTGPEVSRYIGAHLAERGIAFVDCPVSGGVAGAREGRLALMIGAQTAHLEVVKPYLTEFGRLFHVGAAPGMGQLMKVINNLMSAAALAISGEGVTMAVKGGLNPDTVVEVLNAGSGRNSATLDKYPRQILPGTFDAGFSIGLMLKDVRLCLGQAHTLGLSLPVADAVASIWERAGIDFGSDADFTHIVEVAELAAGVAARSKAGGGPAGQVMTVKLD